MSKTIASHLMQAGTALCRGSICEFEGDNGVRVIVSQLEVTCDVLESALSADSFLAPGDEVLVWLSEGDRGVVVGRIARRSPESAPDSVVVEARENLTLRCGEGSITIRKDGKILIKGKDLVSHAQRANRIRGGSVAIN